MRFDDLGIHQSLQLVLTKLGITEHTALQTKLIPLLETKRNVLIRDVTGTGKSFGIVLGLVNAYLKKHIRLADKSKSDQVSPAVVFSAPNPVLVGQIAHWASTFIGEPLIQTTVRGKDSNFTSARPLMLIGTPASLMDRMSAGQVDISSVSTLVLDEVDQLSPPLPRYDRKERECRLKHPKESEILIGHIMDKKHPRLICASATLSRSERQHILAMSWITKDYEFLDGTGGITAPKTLVHKILIVPFTCYNFGTVIGNFVKKYEVEKALAVDLYGDHNPFDQSLENAKKVIRKNDIKDPLVLCRRLSRQKLSSIPGVKVLDPYQSRGIDFKDESTVFLAGCPLDAAEYLHVVGRVARLGKVGTAITIIAPNHISKMKKIMSTIKAKVEYFSEEEAVECAEGSTLADNMPAFLID